MNVITLNDNGTTLLGADSEGNLYDGNRVEVGYDQLTVTTTLAPDGLSFDRTLTYGEHLVGKGTTTREGLLEAWNLLESPVEDQDAAWDEECAISANSPIFSTAYVDGVKTTIEEKLTFVEWTARVNS